MKARLPQGYGAKPSDMNKMFRKVQDDMAALEEEHAAREFSAQSGGGMVDVTVNGGGEIKAINLNPEVVDPEDTEMLSDLLIAALNEAFRSAKDTHDADLEKITGGLNLPGGLF